MFHQHTFTHSYPHDWRSKTPVIFRATEQWFINVDTDFDLPGTSGGAASLRQRALDITAADMRFIPAWGRNRMRGMLESRPDWCVSRQRSWGLPIPAFCGPQSGQVLMTAASVRAVADAFREHGSDSWFTADATTLLETYDVAADPDAPAWARALGPDADKLASNLQPAHDIFDVWFESGSSWNACMVQRGIAHTDPGEPHTDLYLEGSDQHRGWFQLSLLPALGMTGRSPFGAVLTHGFMVDKYGKKMSKSGGNAINVEDLMKDYGADVCRWWVAGLNYADDIKVDWEFFKLAGEEYRKVRNTIRFLLSNLPDFDPAEHRRELIDGDAHTVDAWAAAQLSKLVDTVTRAYEAYEYRRAAVAIFDFCNDAMSAVFLAAAKDRLYCDAADSDRRRRTQTVIFDIADALVRLVAPILVHTADEAYLALHGLADDAGRSAHLERLPEPTGFTGDPRWSDVVALRDRVLKVLEDARAQRGLDNPLDAAVTVMCPPDSYERLVPFGAELADLCGVSRFELVEDGSETIDVADLTDQPRCERSWKRDGTVRQRSDGGWLSDRDAHALGLD
jgi:isoleucyl-tRNA synthetase